MDLRTNIIDILKIISSPVKQYDYENSVPIANVPSELICQWFDDLYFDSDLFRHSFSAEEMEELKKFNDFFDERVDSLPTDGGVKALQNNTSWQEVQVMAECVIRRFGW